MKRFIQAAVAGAAMLIATTAAADTTLSYTQPRTGQAVVNALFPTRGQVITVPPDEHVLLSFTLWVEGPVVPVVRSFANGAIGAVRYSGTTVTGAGQLTETLATPLDVTPGEQIFVGAQWASPNSAALDVSTANLDPNSVFAELDGNGVTTVRSSHDSRFVADFAFVAPPPPVPTLSEWALILFGMVLAGAAFLHLQRRRLNV